MSCLRLSTQMLLILSSLCSHESAFTANHWKERLFWLKLKVAFADRTPGIKEFLLCSHTSQQTNMKIIWMDVFSPFNNPTASSAAITDWLYTGTFWHWRSTASELRPQDCPSPAPSEMAVLFYVREAVSQNVLVTRSPKKWEARVPREGEEGL